MYITIIAMFDDVDDELLGRYDIFAFDIEEEERCENTTSINNTICRRATEEGSTLVKFHCDFNLNRSFDTVQIQLRCDSFRKRPIPHKRSSLCLRQIHFLEDEHEHEIGDGRSRESRIPSLLTFGRPSRLLQGFVGSEECWAGGDRARSSPISPLFTQISRSTAIQISRNESS